ncbi:hypothetical protein N7509_013450 [Penicillium cosmopolitanum]|uniref:Uncharacterized protein n=1 Tax=Penicillium cosmopolitanum TaxID=1131564 RepID=A0A9W9SG21_9EURO|nr:uncharacterized protein N7509_013450 [Penicillium cosmopolitanum]KAJ5376564.1 hypothetical protein N7509_013450 [Penicillium cosmopolitanum]
MASTPSPSTSRLESLPIEVLQLIFLHSLEINLPRSSPILSTALSSQLLYTWLIRLAFSSNNPGSRDNFFTTDFLPPPLDFWSLGTEERASLQTALLSCKWCTLPLFRRCQREYVHHAIAQKSKILRFAPADREILDNLDSLFDAGVGDNFDSCDKALDGRKGKGDIVIPALLLQLPPSELSLSSSSPSSESSSTTTITTTTTTTTTTPAQPQKLAIWLNLGAIQIRPKSEIYIPTNQNIYRLPSPSNALHPAPIPSKLLRSPWTRSQFEFLQLLAPDFYLDEDEHDAERSSAVTSRLIRQRRIEPFRVLLGMYFRARNCRVHVRWPLREVHFGLILRFSRVGGGAGGGKGKGEGDPFARVVLDERWDDIPAEVKEDLLRVVG